MRAETMQNYRAGIPKPGWGTMALLGVAGIAAAIFLVMNAFPYFGWNPQRFGPYWPRRGWLLMHISGGMVALSLGPFALWLGLNRRRMKVHRAIGIAYMTGILVSSAGAYYLATHTDFGLVFGAGLFALATAWLVTTGMALVAIRKRLFAQHQEWMIRSYVVTFSFVTFRILVTVLQMAHVGTFNEQIAGASWFCWAVPLLITEVALQAKKIFTTPPGRTRTASFETPDV